MEFLSIMHQLYDNQEEAIPEAFVGESDFKLAPGYKDFEVREQYIMFTLEQRIRHEKMFYNREHGETRSRNMAKIGRSIII